MDNKPKKPVKYSEEMATRICDLVATSTLGLLDIIKMNPDLPNQNTVYEWRWKHPEFGDRYTRAKQHQAELMAENLNEIAKDVEPIYDEHGNKRIDGGTVQLRKLQIDTMKWQASKLAPRLYGDRQTTETTVTIRHEDALKDLE